MPALGRATAKLGGSEQQIRICIFSLKITTFVVESNVEGIKEMIRGQIVPFILLWQMPTLGRPTAILGGFKHLLSTTAHN